MRQYLPFWKLERSNGETKIIEAPNPSRVTYPKGTTKFFFWDIIFNRKVKIYRFVDDKWENVYYWPARKLIQFP